MAEFSDTRANNSTSIAGKAGSPKRAQSVFQDLNMASLAPTADASANVLGLGASALPPSSTLTAPSPTNAALGSSDWQQMKLSQVIQQLQQHYGQLAAASGGSLNDPYWHDQYDQAVQKESDAISMEASGYRSEEERAAADRQLQREEGGANRSTQEQIAADQLAAAAEARKAEEKSALWSGLGQLGMSALTTPRGAKEASFEFNSGTPAVAEVRDAKGNVITPGKEATPSTMKKGQSTPGTNLLESGGKYLFANSGGFGKDTSVGSSYLLPSMLGSGIGALAGGSKNKSSWASLASGMAGGGISSAASGGSPWANLVASAGSAYANPFSKKSWGGNTKSTLTKLGLTALGAYGADRLGSGLGTGKWGW